MTLHDQTQLKNTKTKLRELQDRYEGLQTDGAEDPRLRDMTLTSLKRLINQLTEEIVRYEIHHPAQS